MVFWKKWKEQAEQYQAWERLHENDYELWHGPFGNAQYSYGFYRLAGDGDADFPSMALSIMQEILAPLQVATFVQTWNFRICKKKETPNPQDYFPARYYSGLLACNSAQRAYYNQAMELITLTDGIDLPLMKALLDRGKREIWSNSVCIYGYRSYPFAQTGFDGIKAALNQDLCDLCAVYEEQHDLLKINVNLGTPTAEYVIQAVQDVCNKYNKQLEAISSIPQSFS